MAKTSSIVRRLIERCDEVGHSQHGGSTGACQQPSLRGSELVEFRFNV